jgi:putative transposase
MRYPSDLTDAQWRLVEALMPKPRADKGRPRTYAWREIVNAVFYLARGGCSWRMLPHDFPPWKTVSYYFYTWRDAGVWDRLHDHLRLDVRALEQREPTPGAAVLDSQTVKTTERGGPKGYDAGEKNRRPQAAPAGRHPRSDLGLGGAAGRRAGPRRRPLAARSPHSEPAAAGGHPG